MPEPQRRSPPRSHAPNSEQTSLHSRDPPETSRDGGRIVVTDRPRRHGRSRPASAHLVHGSDASLGPPQPAAAHRGGGRQQRPGGAATGESPPAGMLPFLTVAIGASAGGLHAYTSFLAALPPDTGMAFVLIQHLDPNHKSLLVSLLQNHTAMPVVEAADGMPLTPDVAFVIPPDSTMMIRHGRLTVTSPAPERVSRHPIDSCFISLGEDQRQHAIAIVLAGAGSDGSAGLGTVKQHGGLTLAQAGDDGLPLAGMPRSAVATGLIDHVLPVGAMPAKLQERQGLLRAKSLPSDDAGAPAVDPEHFAELCALLRHRTGHDFSQYKRPTLLRRIHRRMQAERVATVADFLDLLRGWIGG